MAGVKAVVISPGSRSTPLAYAFASTENLDVYMQVDERSAAYFALGSWRRHQANLLSCFVRQVRRHRTIIQQLQKRIMHVFHSLLLRQTVRMN